MSTHDDSRPAGHEQKPRPSQERPPGTVGPVLEHVPEPGSEHLGRLPTLMRPSQLGVKSRVTTAFGLGTLLLSVMLVVITYSIAWGYLNRQREVSTQRQAGINARLLDRALDAERPNVAGTLDALETAPGSESAVLIGDRWYATASGFSPEDIPAQLQQAVREGQVERERMRFDGESQLVVGVPLESVEGGAYFEVFPLDELESTLQTLLLSLLAAAGVTIVLGVLVGRWASARSLRPLTEAAAAAAAIAGGRLDTRLAPDDDASLAVLAHSFNRMVDALQARIERDARFASDVSHELRSPLTTLVTASQVLQGRRNELSPRGRRALDLLSAEIERFERLVQDLLEISRADAGMTDLALEEVRLAELVRRSGPVLRERLAVRESRGARGTRIRVDKRRMERVIANLVENATLHGGGVTRLEVQRIGDNARLTVDDAGPGIPEAYREQVFERFSRGSGAGDRDTSTGVGLGLALVREHVRLHGGDVWVENSPEGGARFVVELPAVDTPGANQVATEQDRLSRRTPSRADPRTGLELDEP